MLTRAEERFFTEEQALHEAKYLAGTNPRQHSGFGRDERDWERFRRPVVARIETDGSFLDIATTLRREYAERLLERFVASGGQLLVCSYGSSSPEGARAELLVDELHDWGLPIQRIDDAVSPDHGFVITRVVSVARSAALSRRCR